MKCQPFLQPKIAVLVGLISFTTSQAVFAGIPVGACCVNKTCQDNVGVGIDADTCTITLGGLFQGDGTTCATTTCPNVPTTSTWGLVAMGLLLLTAGTLVFIRRSRPLQTGGFAVLALLLGSANVQAQLPRTMRSRAHWIPNVATRADTVRRNRQNALPPRLVVTTNPETFLQSIFYLNSPRVLSTLDALRRSHPSGYFTDEEIERSLGVDFESPSGQGGVQASVASSVIVTVLSKQLAWGSGGAQAPIRLDYSENMGSWLPVVDDVRQVPDLIEADTATLALSTGNVVFKGKAAYPNFDAPIFNEEYENTTNNAITITSADTEFTLQVLLDARGVMNPFGAQATIQSKLPAELLVNGEIVLPDGGILILFELGTTNPQSTAYDFQDMIVLVTPPPPPACVTEASGFGGGDGSVGNPYQVCFPAHLDNVRNHLSSNFLQTGDIDMSGFGNFVPIGDEGNHFMGTYDGALFAIQNLSAIHPTLDHIGLIARLGLSGTLTKIKTINMIVEGDDFVGSLAGEVLGLITECQVDNISNMSTGVSVGGVAGSTSGTISNSRSSGIVTGLARIGGLVGNVQQIGKVSNSYSNAAVSGLPGGDGIGGLVGLVKAGGLIENSYSTGSVQTIGDFFGGLIGMDQGATIIASFWDTQTSGQGTSNGGTGKTTSEMMTQITFDPPWDFTNIWTIDEGVDYPRLNMEN